MLRLLALEPVLELVPAVLVLVLVLAPLLAQAPERVLGQVRAPELVLVLVPPVLELVRLAPVLPVRVQQARPVLRARLVLLRALPLLVQALPPRVSALRLQPLWVVWPPPLSLRLLWLSVSPLVWRPTSRPRPRPRLQPRRLRQLHSNRL